MNSSFFIEHIDPIGQGVSKLDNNIVFVAKTLPGETGISHIYKKLSKVSFAYLEKIEYLKTHSPKRIPSACEHYQRCGGCHFLHTDYQSELSFKTQTLTRLLDPFVDFEKIKIKTISGERFGYRHRIQLHYNINEKKLGFISIDKAEIIEVPNCLIINPKLKKALNELYLEQSWITLLKKHSSNISNVGHIEILNKDEDIFININAAYGDLFGFEQNNLALNHKLKELILQKFTHFYTTNYENTFQNTPPTLWDLFGGKGNLSQNFSDWNSLIIDKYKYTFLKSLKRNKYKSYLNCNLYQKNFLKTLLTKLNAQERKFQRPDFLIIDPPRRGFNELLSFLKAFTPKYLAYVSCSPLTLVRDLKLIKEDYEILECVLLDFFPATYHFETLIFLKKK